MWKNNMLTQWTSFTRGEKSFLLGWAAFLIVTSGIALYLIGGQQYHYMKESTARHSARVATAGGTEKGLTEAETTPPPGHEKDVPREVRVGVYVDRISELSVLSSSWKADFYVWFNWEGKDLNPGETFHVVNGEILSKTLLEEKHEGNRHYALYRTMVQITKVFDIARFPRDDHMLTVSIEDGANQSYLLKYVADEGGSDISSRVIVPGYKILNKVASVRPHSYKTSRGNPDLPVAYKATYSQFIYGIWVGRPTWGLFFKMFIVMFAAALIAFSAFFVKSSCDRLALVSGTLFAAVANMYITSTLIPDMGIATLADQINWIGAAFIVFAIIQAVIYQYFFENREGKEEVIKFYDFMSFVLMLVLYAVLNVCIPVLASV